MTEPNRLRTIEPRDGRPKFDTIEALLVHARGEFGRLSPQQAYERALTDSVIVDIRAGWQRARHCDIAGALIIERNHLEWRLHPRCEASIHPAIQPRESIICEGGYSSSLAAASLSWLGVPATDVIGGVGSWTAARLPLQRSVTPPDVEVPSDLRADEQHDQVVDRNRACAKHPRWHRRCRCDPRLDQDEREANSTTALAGRAA